MTTTATTHDPRSVAAIVELMTKYQQHRREHEAKLGDRFDEEAFHDWFWNQVKNGR